MKIAVDFDGVILDSERYIKYYADYYSYFELGKIRKRASSLSQEDNFDWTEENKKLFFEKYYTKATKVAPFMPGAEEILRKLKEEGHQVYVVTARHNAYFDEVAPAFERLKEIDVDFDGYYSDIQNKGGFCEENGFDLMIDDSPINMKSFIGKNVKALFFKDVKISNVVDKNIKKIDTWMDVYLEVKKMMKKSS